MCHLLKKLNYQPVQEECLNFKEFQVKKNIFLVENTECVCLVAPSQKDANSEGKDYLARGLHDGMPTRMLVLYRNTDGFLPDIWSPGVSFENECRGRMHTI